MVNPLKIFLNLKKEIQGLKQSLAEHKSRLTKPENYLRILLGRNVDWYDYHKLEKQHWLNYFIEAEEIIKSEVFNNELQHFITDIIKNIAMETNSIEEVKAKRQAIVTLQTFKERLGTIEDPRKEETKEDIYNPI